MKYPPIHTVAQEIVDAIKPLVGDRTINIMDTQGIIVASSDPKRIGTFHQGAAEAIASRKVIRISPGQAPDYPGSREGINLPVLKNGEILGAAGIYGIPEEVEQTANLLGVCVGLYLDQLLDARRTQVRKDMELALFRRMLLGELADAEELPAGGRELGLELRLPMRAVIVKAGGAGRRDDMESLNRAYGIAMREGWADRTRDVLAVADDVLALFKHTPPGFDADAFIQGMHRVLTAELGPPVTVALGSRCDEWRHPAVSHREARILADMEEEGCANLDRLDCKLRYLLHGCLGSSVAERHVASLHQALIRGFGDGGMEKVMETIQAYCDAGCRYGPAAAALGLHKNSMNHRVNKILALAGLEGSELFVREFFLRLLVMRHRRRARRRNGYA